MIKEEEKKIIQISRDKHLRFLEQVKTTFTLLQRFLNNLDNNYFLRGIK